MLLTEYRGYGKIDFGTSGINNLQISKTFQLKAIVAYHLNWKSARPIPMYDTFDINNTCINGILILSANKLL